MKSRYWGDSCDKMILSAATLEFIERQCDQRDLLPQIWCEQPTRITPRFPTHLYFSAVKAGPKEWPGKPNNPIEPY